MLLGALNDTGYNAVLVLHILSIVVAFAPAVVHPATMAQVRKAEGDDGLVRFAAAIGTPGRFIYFPGLVLAGLFGGALIGLSKPDGPDAEVIWQFDQTWVWLAILIWVALCGLVAGAILPAERKVAAGDLSAQQQLQTFGGIATVLVVVQVYLMVFKPGF